MSTDQLQNKMTTMSEKTENLEAPLELTGFQRDLLVVIARLDEQRPHGKEIKHELSNDYADEINSGRLYQNLRELISQELVVTRPIDGRTKAYYLSDRGHEWLKIYQEWVSNCLPLQRNPIMRI